MRISSVSWLLLAILISPVIGFGQQNFPQSPVQGDHLFSEKGCSKCHSILGQGGRIGHDLGKINLKGSRLDVASAMLNNAQTMGGKMREMKIIRPHLTGAEIENLIAFLYYVNYFDEPGNSTRGKGLFKERQCIRCHTDPSSFPRGMTPIYLAKTLWNHGPRMSAQMSRLGIPWPRFEGVEMMDLVAYLRETARSESATTYGVPGNPNEGRKVYRSKGCPQCHGGSNDSTQPNLANPALGLQVSLTQTVSRLWNHAPQMFSRLSEQGLEAPHFSEREIADLVAYIYFLNYFDSSPDLTAGRKLFADKQCNTCHSLGGGIQGAGPDLSASPKASSSIDMVAAMWNHTPFMHSVMQEKEIPWPRFEKGELNDLLGYIQSLKK
ncbi:MAG: c-type cytochrome [Deltaproteobacteria bacterium]|nr:c-type cytochrome [Deltaproteobacteria bacterium]